MPRILLALAAANGFVAVAAGAFGAHALKARLAPDLLAVFETGARYHLVHAVAMFAAGLLFMLRPSGLASAAGWAFLAGMALFSGSLYALALSGVRALGAVTPVGGVAFLAGWVLLGFAALRT